MRVTGGIAVVLWLTFGAIPALIAKSKGRSFGLWFFFGLVCFLVALIAALVVEARRPCSRCGSPASVNAAFCPTCGESLPRQPTPARTADLRDVTGGMTPMHRDEIRRRGL